MNIKAERFPGLLVIEPDKIEDSRGFFSETFRESVLQDAGFKHVFVQENHAYSSTAGVLRGLHYQTPPHGQDKLIRVVRGAIRDVVVDLRVGSPTYKQWYRIDLSAENWKQLLVPAGFAHGYLTLESNTEVLYKTSEYYTPSSDAGILWNDPQLGIDWQLAEKPILSERDQTQPLLSEIEISFSYEG